MELKQREGFYMTKQSNKERIQGALRMFAALCWQIMMYFQQLILQPRITWCATHQLIIGSFI